MGNMCFVTISCPVRDAKNFEINYNYLVKPFSYIPKKSGQKHKFLKNKKRF